MPTVSAHEVSCARHQANGYFCTKQPQSLGRGGGGGFVLHPFAWLTRHSEYKRTKTGIVIIFMICVVA